MHEVTEDSQTQLKPTSQLLDRSPREWLAYHEVVTWMHWVNLLLRQEAGRNLLLPEEPPGHIRLQQEGPRGNLLLLCEWIIATCYCYD